MLSELQFERFVDWILKDANVSELANTPFLLSLILDLFRWGIVGTDKHLSKGKLYYIALKKLIGHNVSIITFQYLKELAKDSLIRN